MRLVSRLGALGLVGAFALASCSFDSKPENPNAPPSDMKPEPAKDAGGTTDLPLTMDAGGSSSLIDSGPVAMDASVDANVPTRDDAGFGDGGQFGDDPTPDDPDAGKQTGGLKCGNAFCPFATAPAEPCCTEDSDVELGVARASDRCGVSFALAGSDFYGDHCWQADQPGVVDEACPPVQVDLNTEEPGCCNDRGRCGGVDSERGLGCHVDPAAEEQSCGPTGQPDGGVGCDVTGTYAMRMQVDLAWGGRSGGLVGLTDDGRGLQVVDMLVRIDNVDPNTLELSGSFKPCNVELPTFYSSTLCEAYEPVFPFELWESAKMPTFGISGHLQCTQPGCIASIDAQTVLLGIELDNPQAPWPTASQTPSLSCASGKGAECFPDHDDDDRAGLSVGVATTGRGAASSRCRSGYAKKGAPLSASVAAIFDGVRRTDRVLLGVRMKLGASMKLADSCEAAAGSGIAEFVNSRAWGCYVERGTANFPWGREAGANDPCSSDEAAFMDANLPIYEILAVGETPPSNLNPADKSVSAGPVVDMVRVGDADSAISCADIRAAIDR